MCHTKSQPSQYASHCPRFHNDTVDRVITDTGACTDVAVQDEDYKAAGATIADRNTSFKADIVLKVRAPTLQEVDLLKERAR